MSTASQASLRAPRSPHTRRQVSRLEEHAREMRERLERLEAKDVNKRDADFKVYSATFNERIQALAAQRPEPVQKVEDIPDDPFTGEKTVNPTEGPPPTYNRLVGAPVTPPRRQGPPRGVPQRERYIRTELTVPAPFQPKLAHDVHAAPATQPKPALPVEQPAPRRLPTPAPATASLPAVQGVPVGLPNYNAGSNRVGGAVNTTANANNTRQQAPAPPPGYAQRGDPFTARSFVPRPPSAQSSLPARGPSGGSGPAHQQQQRRSPAPTSRPPVPYHAAANLNSWARPRGLGLGLSSVAGQRQNLREASAATGARGVFVPPRLVASNATLGQEGQGPNQSQRNLSSSSSGFAGYPQFRAAAPAATTNPAPKAARAPLRRPPSPRPPHLGTGLADVQSDQLISRLIARRAEANQRRNAEREAPGSGVPVLKRPRVSFADGTNPPPNNPPRQAPRPAPAPTAPALQPALKPPKPTYTTAPIIVGPFPLVPGQQVKFLFEERNEHVPNGGPAWVALPWDATSLKRFVPRPEGGSEVGMRARGSPLEGGNGEGHKRGKGIVLVLVRERD